MEIIKVTSIYYSKMLGLCFVVLASRCIPHIDTSDPHFPSNSGALRVETRPDRAISIPLCQSLGSCPPTLSVDKCDAECGPSLPCNSTQLCCPTSCGGAMCVDAMTQRHFVNLVKKGRCPEYPRGVWVCSHTCTGDSDCPRTLKCCPNRCGALTCQRPEAEEVPQPL